MLRRRLPREFKCIVIRRKIHLANTRTFRVQLDYNHLRNSYQRRFLDRRDDQGIFFQHYVLSSIAYSFSSLRLKFLSRK